MKKSSRSKKSPIGVIVARFQVAELHKGHEYLITYVRQRHEDVFIALGTRGGVRTSRNQLTFDERRIMVEQTFPEQRFTIAPVWDHPLSSKKWSKNLDKLIKEKFPGRKAILYGARDSFIPYYSGKFKTKEIDTIFPDSGTAARKALTFPHTRDARAAILYEMERRPDFVYSASDLAIVDWENKRVLLIEKDEHDGKFSFAGGHAEKADGAAMRVGWREGREEVLGVGIGPLEPVDAIIIDDPRYKGTEDAVMSNFFVAQYHGGDPSPGDDADYVHWVSFEKLVKSLTPWHKPLGKLLLQKLKPYL